MYICRSARAHFCEARERACAWNARNGFAFESLCLSASSVVVGFRHCRPKVAVVHASTDGLARPPALARARAGEAGLVHSIASPGAYCVRLGSESPARRVAFSAIGTPAGRWSRGLVGPAFASSGKRYQPPHSSSPRTVSGPHMHARVGALACEPPGLPDPLRARWDQLLRRSRDRNRGRRGGFTWLIAGA